jgi:hypothetical protein
MIAVLDKYNEKEASNYGGDFKYLYTVMIAAP